MKLIFALLVVVPYALAQFCGPDEIPDKIAINQNGEVALGCRYNECPRPVNDVGIKSATTPKCGKRYYELSCGGPLQWVGGIPRGSNLNNVVPLQCCTAQKLRDSPAGKSQKIVEPGQVFEGTVRYDRLGNVRSYDVIKNVQKVRLGEGRYALSVTVGQLNCGTKRAAQFDNAEAAEQGFGDIVEGDSLPSEADGTFQGPLPFIPGLAGGAGGDDFNQGRFNQGGDRGFGDQGFGDQGFEGRGFEGRGGETVQEIIVEPQGPADAFPGDFGQPGLGQPGLGQPALGQPAPPFAPPPIPPAAPGLGALGALGAAGAGAGACFTGDTMVETPAGPKRMDELKIGDQVLAVMNEEVVGFSPVTSFLHRLPEKETDFHKISTDSSSVTLTAQHYIYTTPCNSIAPKMKLAKDVMPGQECLIRIDGVTKVPVAIQTNEIVRSTGIYNPITDAGTVVADGFMASVHNVMDDASFMNTFIESIQRVQKFFAGELTDNNVELPWALRYVIDYTSKLF